MRNINLLDRIAQNPRLERIAAPVEKNRPLRIVAKVFLENVLNTDVERCISRSDVPLRFVFGKAVQPDFALVEIGMPGLDELSLGFLDGPTHMLVAFRPHSSVVQWTRR